jgi:colicin import membrane protein
MSDQLTETRPPQRAAVEPGKRISMALAIAMHVLLAVFLIYGVNWQTKAPAAVEVELVSQLPPTPTPAAVPPAPTPEPPKPEPKPEPKIEPKPEPKPAPPPPKPDIAVKDPKQKPPPKEPPKVEPPKPDPFQEQLKREAAQMNQRKLAAALDQEVANAKAAQNTAARNKATADWLSKIRGKIRGKIVLPPDVKGNPEAIFDVVQLPSGEIISTRLKKSSGNQTLDAAIERAIINSSPLPKPEQSELFRRDLELRFRPLDD